MADPKGISIILGADITQLNSALNAAAKNLDAWSKRTMGGFAEMGKSLTMLGVRFAVMTAPITAAAAAIYGVTSKTAEAGNAIYKMSQQTGIGAEKLSGLKYAAELSDISLEELGVFLAHFSKGILETAQGTGAAKDAFETLGIKVKDASGNIKPTSALLAEVADKFSKTEDGAAKSAIATELFGRAGVNLITFLNQGSAGLEKLQEEAKKLGITFTDDGVKAANEFNDAITKLKETINGLIYTIGKPLIGVLNDFFGLLQGEGYAALGKIDKKIEDLKRTAKSLREEAKGSWFFGGRINASAAEIEKEIVDLEKQKEEILTKLHKSSPSQEPKKQLNLVDKDARRAEIEADAKETIELLKKHNAELDEAYKTSGQSLELAYKQGLVTEEQYMQAKAALKNKAIEIDIEYLEGEKKVLTDEWNEKEKFFKDDKERKKAEGEYKAQLAQRDTNIAKKKEEQTRVGIDLMKEETEAVKKLAEAHRQANEKILESANNLKKQRDSMAVERGDMSPLESKKREIEYEQQLLELQIKNKKEDIASPHTDAEKVSLTAEIITLQERLAGAGEKIAAVNKEISGSFGEGWEQGMKVWLSNIQTAFQTGVSLAQTTANAMSQAFEDFFFDVMTGKAKSFQEYFKGFANAILHEISRILAAQAAAGIAKLVLSAVGGGYTSTSGGYTAGGTISNTNYAVAQPQHSGGLIMHKGGYIPRFHAGGLNSDEVPAILQKGEYVVSRRGVAALDRINSGQAGSPNVNVAVNVQNNSSQPVNAKKQDSKWDGKQYVVNIILDDLEHGGPISNGLRNAPA